MNSLGRTLANTRYRQASKEINLPKISRTIEVPSHSFSAFEPIQSNYDYLSDRQIAIEYQGLRQQLLRLNEKAVKLVTSLQTKSLRKSEQAEPADRRMQLLEEEAKNNDLIIDRLILENKGLTTRLEFLKGLQRQDLADVIEETQKKVHSLKMENKVLSQRTVKGVDILEITEQMQTQLKRLEEQNMQLQRKLRKLESRRVEVASNHEKVLQNLGEIESSAELAASVLQKHDSTIKSQRQKETLSEQLCQRQRKVIGLQKNIQSIRRIKEIKYFKILKEVEQIEERLASHQAEIDNKVKINIQATNQLEIARRQLSQIKNVRLSQQPDSICPESSVKNTNNSQSPVKQNSRQTEATLTKIRTNPQKRIVTREVKGRSLPNEHKDNVKNDMLDKKQQPLFKKLQQSLKPVDKRKTLKVPQNGKEDVMVRKKTTAKRYTKQPERRKLQQYSLGVQKQLEDDSLRQAKGGNIPEKIQNSSVVQEFRHVVEEEKQSEQCQVDKELIEEKGSQDIEELFEFEDKVKEVRQNLSQKVAIDLSDITKSIKENHLFVGKQKQTESDTQVVLEEETNKFLQFQHEN